VKPEEMYKKGLKLIIASTRKNIPEALNSKIKSLNYLNNILAKIEATEAGADEAVMINADGFVAECTSENIFVVKNGVIYTPPGYVGLLEGITRGAVIEIARSMGLDMRIDLLNSHDLFVADECFLTGTGAEMIAAVEINGRVIGNGKPGPFTTKLLAAFRELTKVDGTPIYQGLAKENSRHSRIVKAN
ncbi:MAG: aminotransferase class IV, partial [Firmicutes bacterium]|nr:aminotransferase class IV [Bacillota bacterium]